VDSYPELVAATKALAMQPRAKGNAVAMISNGASSMVQGIDLIPDYGLMMKPLAESSFRKLQAIYPPFYLIQNPIDVTGSASAEDYRVGIQAMMDDRKRGHHHALVRLPECSAG
jgi:3-hydroxypropionyl-CoA synthetase (ADP-forming)